MSYTNKFHPNNHVLWVIAVDDRGAWYEDSDTRKDIYYGLLERLAPQGITPDFTLSGFGIHLEFDTAEAAMIAKMAI